MEKRWRALRGHSPGLSLTNEKSPEVISVKAVLECSNPSHPSQPIPKSHRLPIRHILIILRPQLHRLPRLPILLLRFHHPRHARQPCIPPDPLPRVSPPIHPRQIPPQPQRQRPRDEVAGQNRAERRAVRRRLVAAEQMRPRDVPGAVRREHQRRHRHLLAHALVVRLHERHRQRQRPGPRGEEEVSEERGAAGHVGARVDEGAAGDAEQREAGDQQAVGALQPAGDPAGGGDGGGADEAGGDVEEGGLQRGEAEGFDDEVAEVLGPAVGDLREEGDRDEKPGLGVDEAFAGLGP